MSVTMSTVYKRQVDDDRYAQLLDLVSGRLIFNCAKPLAQARAANSSEKASTRFHEAASLLVNTPYEGFGCEGVSLAWDEMANGEREIKSQVIAFVQYACVIAHTLESGKDILVYCKNGRSRSPNAMAVFFLLFRGYSRDKTENWFHEAFPDQRPATSDATKRGNFPNFERFHLVLEKIDNSRHPENKENSDYYDLVRGMCMLSEPKLINSFAAFKT